MHQAGPNAIPNKIPNPGNGHPPRGGQPGAAGPKNQGPKTQAPKKQHQNQPKPDLSSQEQALSQRAAAKARKDFISFVAPVGAISALLGLAAFFVQGPKLAAAAGGAPLAFALAYRYPRQALWFFFFYMPFSGTVTYWLAGGNALFQLAKDAFYFPAVAALLALASKQRRDFWNPRKIMPWMGVLLAVCIMGILFVNLPRQFLPPCTETAKLLKKACAEGKPFPQGLLGLKVFMGYVPLIFCMQALVRDRRDFLFFTRSHVILAGTCALLSLAQLAMLKTGRCAGTDALEGDALFKATLEAKCLVGGSLVYSPSQNMIRLPGTFVAPWQWGWFLISNTFFTFATAFFDRNLIWRLLGFGGLVAVLASAVISGQRIAFALVPLFIVVLILALLATRLIHWFWIIPIAVVVVGGIGLGTTLYADVVMERLDSFISRWQASPPTDMIAHQFNFIMPYIRGKPLGNGLGSATNSARMFGPTLLVETWFPKIMYEVGLVGLVAFLVFVTALTGFCLQAFWSTQDSKLKGFSLCFWIFVFFISYQTYYYPLDVDPVAVYYWALIGVILRLPALEKAEQQAAREVSSQAESEISSPANGKGGAHLEPPRFAPVRSPGRSGI